MSDIKGSGRDSHLTARLRVMYTLRIAAIVLLWATGQSVFALDPPPPTATELREGAAGSCVRAAKQAGIDYAQSLDRAIANDPVGLAALFRFTDTGWFDGAAEGHCAILFGLLQRWGDRPFARVLRMQKRTIRKAVLELLARCLVGTVVSTR
jgi:hypothetical protein